MACSNSGHSPGQAVVGVGVRQDGGLVGQESVAVGQKGPQPVGLGIFMVGTTALMLVVALACLFALCIVASGCSWSCSAIIVQHFCPPRRNRSRGVGTPQVCSSAGMLPLVNLAGAWGHLPCCQIISLSF